MNDELMMTELAEIKDDVKAIKCALYETDNRPGVLSRLRLVEATISTLKRIMWLTIGSALTLGVAVVANLMGVKLP
jgi:hypothetical protein